MEISLPERVMRSIKKQGVATYTQLEDDLKEIRNKLRWACSDLKTRQLIKQTEDPETKEVAWKISPKGELHLAGRLTKQKPETPAKKATKHVGRACETPADGGDNIIRSQASAEPVGQAATSTEGEAVVETQAVAKPTEEGVTPPADRPAGSDVTNSAHGSFLEKYITEDLIAKAKPPFGIKLTEEGVTPHADRPADSDVTRHWNPITGIGDDMEGKPFMSIQRPCVEKTILPESIFDTGFHKNPIKPPRFIATISHDGELTLRYGKDTFTVVKEDIDRLGEFIEDTRSVWG